MYDSDIFGVGNPENGEIGYCCVLGNEGEFYGLAVYTGTKGLQSYFRMQSDENINDKFSAWYIHDCLSMLFADRKKMPEEELQMIKQLGLKIRGENAYPLFRNFLPGYCPWLLNRGEAIYLTQVVQQALIVCERCKDDKKSLWLGGLDHYLVRMPENQQGIIAWENEYYKSPSLKIEEKRIEWDEMRIQKIKDAFQSSDSILEIGFFYSPEPIRESDERPYFPYVCFIIEQNLGVVVSFSIGHPCDFDKEFIECFLKA